MTQIQIRRDQSNVWQARNPTLAAGEFGVELDTLSIKVGNGNSDWISLPYVAGAGAVGLQSGDNVSELVNDVGYLTEAEVNNILAGNYPDGNTNPGQEKYLKSGDNVSELLNDLGYLTEAIQSGDNVSELNNDAGYLTDSEVNQIITDGGYISGVDKLDDIGDVSVAGATIGQVLRYNGSNWVSETVEGISDNLVFRGSVDCTVEEAPVSPVIGWYYFNTGTGSALASWTGISLESVVNGDRLVYGADNQWHIAGNVNDSGNVTLDSLSVTVIEPAGDGDLSYNNSNGVFTFTPADLNTSNVRLSAGVRGDFLQLATRADVTPPADLDTQQDANVLDVAILTNHETRIPKSMTEAEASDLDVYHNVDTNQITVKGVSEYAKLSDANQSITAKEFIGDGSKLTNLRVAPINEVLAEGNTADPAQSLHFNISGGDLPPIRTVDTIDFDGSAGLRLGGLVSYYHINEPFTVDTGSGDVSEFEYATRQMTAVEDYYRARNSEGDVYAWLGLQGFSYANEGVKTLINKNQINLRLRDKDNRDDIFEILVDKIANRSYIKAGQFIGDGSQLTNLNLTGYATETYVDEAIDELGDILVLKGSLDFTTDPAPDVFTVGDVYANTGTGTPHSSWSLSGDVAPGELYGRGETQWGLVGSSDVDLSEYARLTDLSQSITALEFIGNGSKLTDLPLSGYATETYVTDAINAIPGVDLAPYARLNDPVQSINAFEFIGDGSKLTNLPSEVKFINVEQQAPADAKPGDLYLTYTEERTCIEACHLAFNAANDACGGDESCEQAAFQEYIACSNACYDSLTTEQAEALVTRNINFKGIGVGGFAHSSFTAFAGEFVANGTYIFVDEDGNWQRAPIPEVDLSDYAKLVDVNQSITAKEFIGDGSKLTNLPGGAVGIDEVLAQGNTAEALQSMRFRLGAESAPDPDNLNPDPILLEDGIGSAHRALASSWTAHIQGTGGLHSDANANYFVNYILDENASPLALAKVNANYGFSFYKHSSLADGDKSIAIEMGDQGIDVSSNFKVDHEGSVEAKEFIGDGSKLTNLPSGVKFIDVEEPAPADAKPGDLYVNFTPYKYDSCPDDCHAAWAEAVVACGEDLSCESAAFNQYIECLGGCDPSLSREQAEKLAKKRIQSPYYSFEDGGYAHDSFTGIAGDPIDNYTYIVLGEDGRWHKPLVDWTWVQRYAELRDSSQSITAKEFIGDGSKLTNLPVADVDLSPYALLNGRPDPNGPEDGLYQEGQTIESGKLYALRGWYKNDLSTWSTIGGQAAIVAEFSENGLSTGLEPHMGANKVHIAAKGWGIYQDSGQVVSNRLQNLYLKTEFNAAKSNVKLVVEGPCTATEFIGDGSKLTNLPVADSGVKFIDVEEPAPADAKPGDLYLTYTEDEVWGEICQGDCHADWIKAHDACLGDESCESAAFMQYAICLNDCDDSLSREQAEALAKRNIKHLKGRGDDGIVKDGGGFAHSSFTAFAREFVPNGSYIFVDEEGNWQKAPITDLDKYAELNNPSQSITAKQFIGDGSKLTGVGLPDFRTLTPLT